MASSIVFANKLVFEAYSFKYPIALTWAHTLATLAGSRIFARLGMFTPKTDIPVRKVLPLAVAFIGYIVLNNASLQINTVSFYQIAKIAVAPTVLCLEVVLLGKRPTWQVVASVALVCAGVGLATLNDSQIINNTIGLFIGCSAVMFTAVYQLWAGSKQKELNAGSN